MNAANYCYEERFTMFDHDDYLNADDAEGNMGLSTGEDIWQWEVEKELNGDIAMIPVSSDIAMDYLTSSPPVQHDWNDYDWNNAFEYPEQKPTFKSPGKKIDLSAMCYIVNGSDEPEAIKQEALDIKEEIFSEEVGRDGSEIDIETISAYAIPILQAGDVDSLLEQFEATENVCIKIEPETLPAEPTPTNIQKRKQIVNTLPDELIKRIKASSQRRSIPVIEPIHPQKRKGKTTAVAAKVAAPPLPVKCAHVIMDHDYCATFAYPKHPTKDSGFVSDEDERNVSKKDCKGRLGVLRLKSNLIKEEVASVKEPTNTEKRKLNLEEYKKRRKVVFNLPDDPKTVSNSQTSLDVEDEKSRLLKHQLKLKQMAADVLKTPPRSKLSQTPKTSCLPAVNAAPLRSPTLPENIEVKVLVSVGVNTDEHAGLKAIRPILETAIDKLDRNSLIASVIQNIQNQKDKEATSETAVSKEHGEDKTIVYLDKCRKVATTRDIFVQVDMALPEDEVIQKRGRSTTVPHRKAYKRRCNSNGSSCSSSSMSTLSSRSRSRSPTTPLYQRYKKHRADEERLREVEERRIIYIGKIASGTTKEDLYKRFHRFGTITKVSVHCRDFRRDNYGFVTFAYAQDAYKAIEHGNDDSSLPQYELSFGGRRIFCGSNYSDLDNVHEYTGYGTPHEPDSFDSLLREAQAKMRKRKT